MNPTGVFALLFLALGAFCFLKACDANKGSEAHGLWWIATAITGASAALLLSK
ncbi:hypothetical protein [Paraburkholderia fungorum]|uniref:hypothetical protein n=1 Tax=Paraburkholderia fungorum TaxID=134537 RepID=UPI0038779F50